ncbi:hypothetical protein [Chryseolinea serpens]|nr:hypothetical protein [Chryseolinea serpens]
MAGKPFAHHGFGLPIGGVLATERITAGFSCNALVKALLPSCCPSK